MSIEISHGYRIWLRNPLPFLRAVAAVVAPVRDLLDATLYAQIVADLVDRHDHGTYQFVESLKLDALHEFETLVQQGPVDSVFHHPHSFDLDLGYLPLEPGPDRWMYALVHCQRQEYRDAFATIPGVQRFTYWTGSDRPSDVTAQQWTERREAWRPLIEARRISDVMSRWTYRDNPTPEGSYVLRDDIILSHLPSVEERASRLAGEQAVAEHVADSGDVDDLKGVVAALHGPRRRGLAVEYAKSVRVITAADLNAIPGPQRHETGDRN